MGVSGKNKLVHRVAWEAENGEIPHKLTIDHLCRVKLCCNVKHLEVVSLKENIRRHHAAKTHCPHGHEYDTINTLINSRGARSCRTCKVAWTRNWRAKNE